MNLDALAAYEARVDAGGGRARQRRLTRMGRLTARARIAALVDADSFVEWGRYRSHQRPHLHPSLAASETPGDGVVTGLGTVGGRRVGVVAHDPTVRRGDIGSAGAAKIARLQARCLAQRLPLLTLADSIGARIVEGVEAVAANGEVMHLSTRLQGVAPQITLAVGMCAGAAAYTAALGDLIGMVRDRSFMFITGPTVCKAAVGEDVSIDALGGHELHARHTGACHHVADDEQAGIAWVRRLVSYLEPVTDSDDPVSRPVPEVATIVPTDHRYGYDMRKLVHALFDQGSVTELSPAFAPNLLTVIARLGGRAVAVVASQPMHLAGTLDVDASRKGARFVRAMAGWGLPVVTLADIPGYLPGLAQERAGIVPIGAELLTAYARVLTPKLCLLVRKSFGGGNILSYAADVRLALPTGRVGAMGTEAALSLELGPEPADPTAGEQAEREARRTAWLARHDTVIRAAEVGYLDGIVRPEEARHELSRALETLVD